jgi:hypothetical protein
MKVNLYKTYALLALYSRKVKYGEFVFRVHIVFCFASPYSILPLCPVPSWCCI